MRWADYGPAVAQRTKPPAGDKQGRADPGRPCRTPGRHPAQSIGLDRVSKGRRSHGRLACICASESIRASPLGVTAAAATCSVSAGGAGIDAQGQQVDGVSSRRKSHTPAG